MFGIQISKMLFPEFSISPSGSYEFWAILKSYAYAGTCDCLVRWLFKPSHHPFRILPRLLKLFEQFLGRPVGSFDMIGEDINKWFTKKFGRSNLRLIPRNYAVTSDNNDRRKYHMWCQVRCRFPAVLKRLNKCSTNPF